MWGKKKQQVKAEQPPTIPQPYPNVMKKDGWEKALQESKRYEGVLYWGHEN